MKKTYVSPEVEILTFSSEGCLCLSLLEESPDVLDLNETWDDNSYDW